MTGNDVKDLGGAVQGLERQQYVVSSDGQRFLMSTVADASALRRLRSSSFNATSRSSWVSRARYTSPMPPLPSSDRTSYGPSLVPTVRLTLGHAEVLSLVLLIQQPDRPIKCGTNRAAVPQLIATRVSGDEVISAALD
jgi:hypothetical protein